jgi:hypothetical protein
MTEKSIKAKRDKERKMMATQKSESTFKERSTSGVADTLRTEPWQCVFDCNTTRRRFSCRKHEFLELLRKLRDVDFELLGLPLLLL